MRRGPVVGVVVGARALGALVSVVVADVEGESAAATIGPKAGE